MLINNPIHQLEASESDGENDPRVFINVRRRHAEHLVELLHVALRIGRRRGWRWHGRPWRRRRRHRRRMTSVFGVVDVAPSVVVVRGGGVVRRRGRPAKGSVFAVVVRVAVATDGVFARGTLAVHFGVVDFEVDSLENVGKNMVNYEFYRI